MKMSVCKMFRFDAAHYLPNYVGKCKHLHGHGWILEVEVTGEVSLSSGFVIDFAELKKVVNLVIIDKLDHTCLNDLSEAFSSNPTCENVLTWMWNQLEGAFYEAFPRGSVHLPKPEVCRLRLYETPDSFAELKL